jgi:antibiotic biosynthesis monooxygenase (ABM) superfamily enzyme
MAAWLIPFLAAGGNTMNPLAPDPAAVLIEARKPRASSVIVHRVPAGSAERFTQWQQGVTQAAQGFPGYLGTEQYPPADAGDSHWVVVVHFADAAALQHWLDSPERAAWTAKLPPEVADFRLKTLSGGFGPWFAGLVDADAPLPRWKMALSVLFGLYPTVMLLGIFSVPHTQSLGLAVSMLLGNVASCLILEWLGMPVVRLVLGRWLRANGKSGRTVSLVGTALVLAALGLMTFLFSRITG